MKILVIGPNRSGTTLLWKSLQCLLNYSSFNIQGFFSDYIIDDLDLNSKRYISIPTIDKFAYSTLYSSETSKFYNTQFALDYPCHLLPNNCLLRVNHIDYQQIDYLQSFDLVFFIMRDFDSLYSSNLRDLPPAFEALDIQSPSRDILSSICLLDEEWSHILMSYLKTQHTIQMNCAESINNSVTVSFKNLLDDHILLLRSFSEKLELQFTDSQLIQISKSLLFKSQSRWSTHYTGGLKFHKHSKFNNSLSLEENILDRDLLNPLFFLFANYKKLLFCGEFNLPVSGEMLKLSTSFCCDNVCLQSSLDDILRPLSLSLGVYYD